MRTLSLFSLLAAAVPAIASGPEKLTVVVHTSERVVAQYVCTRSADKQDLPLGTKVRKAGLFNWHVVGGTVPYTVLKDEMTTGQTRCITVMDATGQVATACGIVGTRVEVVEVNCNLGDKDTLVQGLVPDAGTDAARGMVSARRSVVADDITTVEEPPVFPPLPIPETYHPPVKQIDQDNPPPVPVPTGAVKGTPQLDNGGHRPPSPPKAQFENRKADTGTLTAPSWSGGRPTGSSPAPAPSPSPKAPAQPWKQAR